MQADEDIRSEGKVVVKHQTVIAFATTSYNFGFSEPLNILTILIWIYVISRKERDKEGERGGRRREERTDK